MEAESPPILKAATLYGLSNVLQRLIPFLILPVLTRVLSQSDLGLVALFTAVTGVATPLVGVNLSYAVQRRYFDLDEAALGRYLGNALLVLALGSSSCALLAWLAGGWVETLAGLPAKWVQLAIVYSASQVIMLLPLTLWQVRHQAGTYVLVQVGRTLLQGGLTLLFVLGFELGWEGALWATLASGLLSVLFVAVPVLIKRVRLELDRDQLAHLLRYGGGLLPHTLGALVITSSDRFFISHYAGAAETGLYFVGYQLGLAVSFASDALTRSFNPWLYETLERGTEADKARVLRFSYGAFAGLLALAALIAVLAPVIAVPLLGDRYAGAGAFVGWIALGFAFNGMYRVISGFLFHAERTLTLSLITGLSAVLNVGLDALWVPRFGAVGAAQATAAAFLFSFVATLGVAVQAHRQMPWTRAFRADPAARM